MTVLFADVVDSTGLGERLDPEQVAEIMNGAFAFLDTSVTKYGGTVARLLGDAILAFFGAPVAQENDAERAIRAGLDIQAAAREYAESVERESLPPVRLLSSSPRRLDPDKPQPAGPADSP